MATLDNGNGGLDKNAIIDENKQIDLKWKEISKLGKDFVEDKEGLQKALEHSRKLRDKNKRQEIMRDLELALQVTYEKYQKKVKYEMDKLEALQIKIDKDTEALEKQFAEERDSLEGLKMKAVDWDPKEEAAKAEKERSELEQIALANKEKLNLRIQDMQRQQREMRAKKLSGRE